MSSIWYNKFDPNTVLFRTQYIAILIWKCSTFYVRHVAICTTDLIMVKKKRMLVPVIWLSQYERRSLTFAQCAGGHDSEVPLYVDCPACGSVSLFVNYQIAIGHATENISNFARVVAGITCCTAGSSWWVRRPSQPPCTRSSHLWGALHYFSSSYRS